VGLGIIPGYGGTQRLPRLVGSASQRADRHRPHGRRRRGAADRARQPRGRAGALLEEAYGLAEKIAANAPLAVAAALEAARRGLDLDLDQGLRLESTLFGILGSTKDMHDGLSAFVEKRKPTFEGR
jgi:enoyl-CoA hydratase